MNAPAVVQNIKVFSIHVTRISVQLLRWILCWKLNTWPTRSFIEITNWLKFLTIKQLLLNAGPCWRKENNKGDYPPSALIEEKKVASEEECMDMCEENSDCRAAILSPTGDCHIVNTAEVSERAGWKATIAYKCPGEEVILKSYPRLFCFTGPTNHTQNRDLRVKSN